MKIKDGYILKEVAGTQIVIATGEQKMSFNGVMTFNSVGAEIFKLLDGTNSSEYIVKKISGDYGVSEDVVQKDFDALLEKMRKYDLLDE